MSVDELKTALRETLDRRGILGTMRAHLQSEIFSAIDSQVPGPPALPACDVIWLNMRRTRQDDARPMLSYENMLMNELIREYLEVIIATWLSPGGDGALLTRLLRVPLAV
jgi:lisH domain-containing protein FOPNL